jgi:O-antigen ligase
VLATFERLRERVGTLEQAICDGRPSALIRLAGALTAAGAFSGVLGVYPLFFLLAIGPLAVIACRNATTACVIVALTSPLVAVGAVDVGFHFVPSYLMVIAGLAGAATRREWRGLRWQAADVFAAGFAVVAGTVTLGTLGTAPLTTVPGATGANGRLLRSPAQFAALLLMLGLYGLMRVGIRDRTALHAVVRGLLVSFVLVAAYTAYQFVARLAGLPYAYVNDRRALSQLPIGQTAYVRVNGTLPEASPLAQFSFIATTVGVAALVGDRYRGSLLRTRAALGLLALGLGILLASLSKAAIVAAAIVIPVVIVRARNRAWYPRQRIFAVMALLITVTVAAAGLVIRDPAIAHNSGSVIRSELYLREGYWSAAVSIGEAHPLGVGVGNYTFYYPRYAPLSSEYEFFPGVADAHSWYLEAFAETGILGGVLFLAFVLAIAFEGLRGAGFAGEDREIVIGLGAAWFGGALMHATYSFFYYPFEWVIAGVIGAAAGLGARSRYSAHRSAMASGACDDPMLAAAQVEELPSDQSDPPAAPAITGDETRA